MVGGAPGRIGGCLCRFRARQRRLGTRPPSRCVGHRALGGGARSQGLLPQPEANARGWCPYELPGHGAIVGTERGIELLSTATARKIAWAWTDVRDVEVGRVESTSGRIMWGIVLTVTGPDGEDRIPLAVRPGIYRPFVSRAALTDLARTLRSSAGDRLMTG